MKAARNGTTFGVEKQDEINSNNGQWMRMTTCASVHKADRRAVF